MVPVAASKSGGPTGPDLSGSYDAWHHRFDAVDETDSPWHTLVKSSVGDLKASSVLEIGCGRGGLARWVAEKTPRCFVAADFSWAAVSRAAAYASDALTMQADIAELPFADNTFDAIISCETIEHLPNPAAAVRELARCLKPGGRLLLTTPNYMNLMGLFRIYRRLVRRPFTEEGQPINNFTVLPRTVYWMHKAGLHTCLSRSTGYYVPFPRRVPFDLTVLDGHRPILRWLAAHQLLIATKLRS